MERPRFLDREADSLDTKDIIEKFSAAVKLGVGIFANPTFSSVRPTGEESLFDKQFVIPLASGKTAPHSTPSGVVSDIVWLRQDQMLTSVSQSEIPEHWPPAGLLDVFILAVLEPAQKTLSVAVDAGFTKPFGCEDMEPELEEEPEKSQSPWDEAWLKAAEADILEPLNMNFCRLAPSLTGDDRTGILGTAHLVAAICTPIARVQVPDPQAYSHVSDRGVQTHEVAGTGAPKIFPMIATHFVQRRQFLRRWRFEEALKQDLKSGIALSHSMRSAGLVSGFSLLGNEGLAGGEVCDSSSYLHKLATLDARTQSLVGACAGTGCASVELHGWRRGKCHNRSTTGGCFEVRSVLPCPCPSVVADKRTCVRPSWWIDRMGNSVDMPRPHLSAEMEEEPSESLRG